MQITFHEMEIRFGPPLAYDLLAEIEKSAALPTAHLADIDPEIRLAYAFRTQDASMNRCAAAIA